MIDGDTISVRQQRIRIAAIDACEFGQTGLRNGKVWQCGIEGRAFLRRMIDGKHVSCRIIDRDQYRRLVGHCFYKETDVGLAMGLPSRCFDICRRPIRSTWSSMARPRTAPETEGGALVGRDRKSASLPAR
ncbi:thermonuclease family protein [Mesorhizobium sp. M0199]|uniref:thermonuclease family protein n=1 Tax=Mesorhizobium sp. M0199 TaxID=2956911 RepID=UPI00333BDFED